MQKPTLPLPVADRADRIAALLPSIMHSMLLSRTHPAKTAGPALTFHQYHSLLIIREIGPCSLQTLAARLRIATSTTSQLVDRLVRAGLVTRTPDKSDRRMIALGLSAKGGQVLHRRTDDVRKSYMQILALLDEAEQAEFEFAFQTIHDVAEKVELRMNSDRVEA